MNSQPGQSDFKSQVLAATDIVQLIGQSVSLKRAGKDFKGLCPFHNEKTPSFTVSPTKQFFKCYGCKEYGNAIDFVMKRDRIEFVDAMKLLGEKAGLEMPKYGLSKQKNSERQILLDAHSAACAFFEKNMGDPNLGGPARQYLEKRGFTAESIQRFQIGVAANQWDALLRSGAVRKFTPQQLHLAGLLKARENGSGYYDTFRNRLMFPIRDEAGRIIAFGGRVMPGGQDPAKYLNSPETPLFSKSRCVYGLDLARQRIVETRTVAVVEGYTDVVMAHQFGVSNVVSILGTAMTEQHIGILKRFADRVVLLFDADTAGDTAADKAVSLFLTQDIEIAIASMPEGIDPDEFLLRFGAAGFEKMLGAAVDALTFKWKQLSARFQSHANDLTGQQKAVQEYLDTLADARGSGPVDALRWGAALSRVSKLTEIPTEELHKRFKGAKRPAPSYQQAASQTTNTTAPTVVPNNPRKLLTARERAERWIMGCLLVEPGRWTEVQQHVHVDDFMDPTLKALAEVYWAHQRDEGEPAFNEFLGVLQDAAVKELAVRLVEQAEAFEDMELSLRGALDYLVKEKEVIRQQKLVAELRRKSVVPSVRDDSEVDLLKQIQENKKLQSGMQIPKKQTG